MKTFNLFFKLAAQSKSTIILGLALFVTLVIPMSLFVRGSADKPFQIETPKLIVIQKDHGDAISDHFVSYLQQRTNVVSLDYEGKTAEEMADDLFYKRADYILTIPRGFGKSLLTDEKGMMLEKQVTEAVKSEALVDTVIQSYLQNLEIQLHFLANDATAQEIQMALERVEKSMDTNMQVSVSSTSQSVDLHIYGEFYQLYMCYVMIMLLLQIYGAVNIAMEQEEVLKRNILGNMGRIEHFVASFAASFVLAFGLWCFFILVAVILTGADTVFSPLGIRMTLASFLTMLGIHAFTYFIASLLKTKGSVGFVSNLVSLFVAFASGIFVPYEFIHPLLKQLVSVAPPIWLVKSNRLMLEAVDMTAGNQQEVIHYILILGLLAMAYHTLTFVTKRFQYAKRND